MQFHYFSNAGGVPLSFFDSPKIPVMPCYAEVFFSAIEMDGFCRCFFPKCLFFVPSAGVAENCKYVVFLSGVGLEEAIVC